MKKIFFNAVLLVLLSCAIAAAQEQAAHQEQEQGVFSGTLADAIWTIIVFVILLAILGKFAWKPLINSLKLRQEHIQQQIENAEILKKEAEKLLEEHKYKAAQIVSEASKQAQREAEELAEKTRKEVLEIRRRAHEDITHAQTAATEKLWQEAAGIVESLGAAVLGRAVTAQDNQQLINETIARLREKKQE